LSLYILINAWKESDRSEKEVTFLISVAPILYVDYLAQMEAIASVVYELGLPSRSRHVLPSKSPNISHVDHFITSVEDLSR
jgi:hypothetical protein